MRYSPSAAAYNLPNLARWALPVLLCVIATAGIPARAAAEAQLALRDVGIRVDDGRVRTRLASRTSVARRRTQGGRIRADAATQLRDRDRPRAPVHARRRGRRARAALRSQLPRAEPALARAQPQHRRAVRLRLARRRARANLGTPRLADPRHGTPARRPRLPRAHPCRARPQHRPRATPTDRRTCRATAGAGGLPRTRPRAPA